MRKKNPLFARVFIAIMLLVIYLPILILMVYSFTTSTTIGAIRGFSLQNYVTLFSQLYRRRDKNASKSDTKYL